MGYATPQQHQTLVSGSTPSCCENGKAVMIGIDEAGRGPVMGPMVYGAAYWAVDHNDAMSQLGFDDSKAITMETREQLFEKMQKETERLGWIVRIIPASEISDQMLTQTSNLNEISRNAAIQLINEVRSKGLHVQKVFVDTVGDPKWYQTFLTKEFNGTIEFCVAKKADSLYKVVSAASIAAKVTRDRIVSAWQWETASLALSRDFGSGYPSDPKTKAWLQDHLDPVFAYPNVVRFSWGTLEPLLAKALQVDWPFDTSKQDAVKDKNAAAAKGTRSITSFLQPTLSKQQDQSSSKSNNSNSNNSKKPQRANFFVVRKIERVRQLL